MADDVFGIVGSVIAGTYQVERVVAEGGFGVVYRAHHVGFRAPVALKCLKIPQQLGSEHQAEFLEQFRAEAELLFRLSASIPTVVRPLHVDAVTLDNGTFVPFMALEWLEGETLEAVVERRKAQGLAPLSLKKLVLMLTPVARALERAHNFMGPDGPISVVHRDMKPENIFIANVAGDEIPKILDFGIGKAKSVASQVAGRASQTHSAFSSFTPAYGAPEQWVPKRFGQSGPWTDVWGLALTLVEVMAGRTIIDGDHAGMMGTVLDPTRRPTPRNEGIRVSDDVEAIFERALAVDPRERYPDAGKFWNDLVQAVGVRGEARDAFAPAPLDARAEGGHVPRVEQVEIASLPPARPPSVAPSSRFAETVPAEVAPRLSNAVPELAEIPDLGPVPERARSHSRPQMPAARVELELEETPPAVDLDLDLPPGERPSLRVPGSSPNWPVPERKGSGTFPAQRPRTASGSAWPAAEAPAGSAPHWSPPISPAPASGRARVASGAQHPAVDSVPPRSASGSFAAVDSSPPRSVSGAQHPVVGTPDPVASVPPPEAPRWSMPNAVTSAGPTPEPGLGRRLAPGIVLLALSIIVTVADQTYASSSGEVFAIGPLRAGWIAGPLMLVGVLLLGLGIARHFRR